MLNSIGEVKRRMLLNGIREADNTEDGYYLDVNNVLLMGIEVVASEDGISAIKNLDFARSVIAQMTKEEEKEKYLNLLDTDDSTELMHKVLLSTDITVQLVSMTKLLYLASEKTLKINKDTKKDVELQNLRSIIQQLESENNLLRNMNTGEVNQLENEIKRLKKLNKELNKENRRLEHELKEIEKEMR